MKLSLIRNKTKIATFARNLLHNKSDLLEEHIGFKPTPSQHNIDVSIFTAQFERHSHLTASIIGQFPTST